MCYYSFRSLSVFLPCGANDRYVFEGPAPPSFSSRAFFSLRQCRTASGDRILGCNSSISTKWVTCGFALFKRGLLFNQAPRVAWQKHAYCFVFFIRMHFFFFSTLSEWPSSAAVVATKAFSLYFIICSSCNCLKNTFYTAQAITGWVRVCNLDDKANPLI